MTEHTYFFYIPLIIPLVFIALGVIRFNLQGAMIRGSMFHIATIWTKKMDQNWTENGSKVDQKWIRNSVLGEMKKKSDLAM